MLSRCTRKAGLDHTGDCARTAADTCPRRAVVSKATMEDGFYQGTLSASGLQFSTLEGRRPRPGDEPRPVVLCLHGFPDNNRTFRAQIAAWTAAGYRVVAPLLRGYEPCSQPIDDDYHTIRMVEDVLGWIEYLGALRVHLVGHDWGAVIGYQVAALAPERLLSLTTLAVPHLRRLGRGLVAAPRQLVNSWYALFFQARGVAELALRARDFALVERLWRAWSPGWVCPAEEMRLVKRTLRQPGVAQAALRYYRAAMDPISRAAAESRRLAVSAIEVPTLALTGADDGCVDTRLFDAAMRGEDFPGGLEVARIRGAGHFLHLERPDEVGRRILEWLQTNDAAE
jgi:pimeloyl-ACP methyl ester carboxylesterase